MNDGIYSRTKSSKPAAGYARLTKYAPSKSESSTLKLDHVAFAKAHAVYRQLVKHCRPVPCSFGKLLRSFMGVPPIFR
jgi:hypothetical protein